MLFSPEQIQSYVAQGRCFSGGTAATGVAPGTAIGTTGAFTLYNPVGSAKRAIPLRVTCGYVSGTLGAGVIHYLLTVSATAVTGTAIDLYNCRSDSANTAGTVALLTTTTLPAAPTVLRPFGSLGASLATTAAAPWQLRDDPMGEFVLYPGSALTLHATAAAGTSPLVVYGMTFLALPA